MKNRITQNSSVMPVFAYCTVLCHEMAQIKGHPYESKRYWIFVKIIGPIATRLGCDGLSGDNFVTNLKLNERILQIGQHLTELWTGCTF